MMALAACGRFAPDRHLRRRVSENEVVGTWRLLPSSLDTVQKDAGYRPAEASRPHDIVFRADGTCHFRSIDEAPPTRTEYFDTEGTWKLVHYPPFSDGKPNEVQITVDIRGINFNLAEVKHRLHLWQFWGDPDEWLFLEYEKT
jgi:hypothetical protein